MKEWLKWFLDRLELGILWVKWFLNVLEWGKTLFNNFPATPNISGTGDFAKKVLNEGQADK
jgi:hypothetical protein